MEFTKAGADAFIRKLTKLIKSNLTNEQFGVTRLAEEMGMSRSNLHRKVKSTTNSSVSQFINRIRLENAMELLKETSLTVSDVAMQSGFNSVTYFTKCFKDQYGYPPAKYRRNEVTEADSDESRQGIVHPGMHNKRSPVVWILSSIVVIISAILLFHLFAPMAVNQNAEDKTIAVLPIRNDSPDKDNAYIINGFMEEILHKLTLIEDLEVVSRTSVEKFRDSDAGIIEIGKELHVNYILEGSAQTIEGKTKIHLQLIDALTDKHLWSQPYKQDLSLENMFEMQEEVALAVASELEIVLAHGEKAQLEQIPTKNIAAYNLYLLGKDFLNINLYSVDKQERYQALHEAKRLFEQAIELDSTFSEAYSVLGSIYIINLYYSAADLYIPQSRGDFEKANTYLDSGLVILDKALFYNKDNHEALACKAIYYETKGMHEEASRIYEILSKNGHLAFEAAVSRYYHIEDYYNAIDAYIRYLGAKPDNIIVPPYLLRTMIVVFRKTGFPDLEKQVTEQLLVFNTDSLEYIDNMVMLENWQGNYQAAMNYGLEAWHMDSTDSHCNLILGLHYYYLDDFTTALKYIRLYEKNIILESGEQRPSIIAGQVYLKNGMEEKARYHLEGGLTEWDKQIELNTPKVQTNYPYIELADVYLALGDQDKAWEYLNMLKGLQTIDLVYLTILKNWPGFDLIRNEPQFLDVLYMVEETYQKEHNRIEKLLIREGMISS